MIQFQILSGKQAGSNITVRRFPLTIGRSPADGLRLEDDGVWDQHVEIHYQRGEAYSFVGRPDAPLLLNGEKVQQGGLKNGDLLEIGAARLRFWLAPTRQKPMRLREILTWAALLALFCGQIAVIYWLLR